MKPYFGAAYYPEAWPETLMEEDIALMKEAGMNVMRMAEFAWSRMEPREGEVEFAWLHRAVDSLGAAGIASILGTPTATPPLWLTQKHPEILFVGDDGRPQSHGGRRHYCPNNPVYREHCARIAGRMALEFGKDENVIGWQVDNEVDYYTKPCACPVCHAKFQDMLKGRFGSIEALNQAWVTALWSQTYDSFSQIPIPRAGTAHHPSLLTAWAEFGGASYVDFVKQQAEVLHANVSQPVGTDMMNTGRVDYEAMHKNLDVVQFNHYHGMGELGQAAFWFDFCRPLKDAPFWNTETATCWNGATTANGYKEPGFCRANSWLPIALGGEATLYWLWRQHRSGQELMHGAVVSSSGRPLHIIDEVKEVARGFRSAAAFVNSTKPVRPGLALHFSNAAQEMFHYQPVVNHFNFPYGSLSKQAYLPLIQAHWRPDIIEPAHDLSAYKLILSPFLPMLDEAGLRPRLKAWIEAGGIWIAGPLTDIRDLHACKFSHSPYGSLEEWGGVQVKMELPGDPRQFKVKWGKTARSEGMFWYDGLECRGAKPLAFYEEGPLKGLAAATSREMGRGRVVLLGTFPSPKQLQALVLALAAPAGLKPLAKASPNLLVVPREGSGGRGLVALELENKPAKLTLERPALDLLSGETFKKGPLSFGKYGLRVLKYLEGAT